MDFQRFPKLVVDGVKRHEVFIEAKRLADLERISLIDQCIKENDPMLKNRLSGQIEGIAKVFRTFDSLAENAQPADLTPVVPPVDMTITGAPKTGL
jgi:hypothetical protein